MNLPDNLLCTNHEVDNADEERCRMNARLKHLNHTLDTFSRRWRREYLLELREAHRHYRSSGEPQLSEGDIVVVFTDDHPRSLWKLGRVERVITGADGQKRAVTIRVSNKGRTSTLDRPIQHLYPMEICTYQCCV